jgi:hypothetical protein
MSNSQFGKKCYVKQITCQEESGCKACQLYLEWMKAKPAGVNVQSMYCNICDKYTPHYEHAVVASFASTAFGCMYCGKDIFPGGGNAMVLA